MSYQKQRLADAGTEAVLLFLEELATPRSLAVALLFKYGEHAQLCELGPPYFSTLDRFRRDLAATELMVKAKFFDGTGLDPVQAAIDGWKATEDKCRETNNWFKDGLQGISPWLAEVLSLSQRKIARLVAGWESHCMRQLRFGPGATVTVARRHGQPDNKILSDLDVSYRALPILRDELERDPHWFEALTGVLPEGRYSLIGNRPRPVPSRSKMTVVWKSASKGRVICAEPTGNSFVQQGPHLFLRRRLQRVGVDLDRQEHNQLLASRAYSEGFATLDLSSASDLNSTELCAHLFPVDFFLLLDDLRTHFTVLPDGSVVKLEKFTSSGNAFCFEVETVVFWALATSVTELAGLPAGLVSVYGDDIIVPQSVAGAVIEALHGVGFKVNPSKSFVSGPFFESCGKQFYEGVDVTPVYQKEFWDTPEELIRLHNRLARVGRRLGLSFSKSLKRLRRAWPYPVLPSIPEGTEGDDGFWLPHKAFTLDPNHGFWCNVYTVVRATRPGHEGAAYAYCLRTRTTNSGPRGHVLFDVRTESKRHRLRRRWVPFADAAS